MVQATAAAGSCADRERGETLRLRYIRGGNSRGPPSPVDWGAARGSFPHVDDGVVPSLLPALFRRYRRPGHRAGAHSTTANSKHTSDEEVDHAIRKSRVEVDRLGEYLGLTRCPKQGGGDRGPPWEAIPSGKISPAFARWSGADSPPTVSHIPDPSALVFPD